MQYLSESFSIENLNDLNKVYHALLGPVKEIEMLSERRERLQKEMSDAKDTLSTKFITPFIAAIHFTSMFAIPFTIIFFIATFLIKNADGVRYSKVYELWFSETTSLGWIFYLLNKFTELFGNIFGGLLAVIGTLIVYVVLPVFIFLLPAMFGISIIVTVISCVVARRKLKSLPGEIKSVENDIDDIISTISKAISFVPPDYRFSDALEYFCTAFDNHKADSLKEAMLQYDDFVHKRKLELNQQEILEKHNETLRMLEYQNSKIDSLKLDVNRVESKVDWLSIDCL